MGNSHHGASRSRAPLPAPRRLNGIGAGRDSPQSATGQDQAPKRLRTVSFKELLEDSSGRAVLTWVNCRCAFHPFAHAGPDQVAPNGQSSDAMKPSHILPSDFCLLPSDFGRVAFIGTSPGSARATGAAAPRTSGGERRRWRRPGPGSCRPSRASSGTAHCSGPA